MLRQLRRLTVIDGDVDETDALPGQGLLHDGLDLTRVTDAEALCAKRVGQLDEIHAAELDAAAAAVLGDFLELDHVEVLVVPDEVRDVAALLHGRRELLAAEHEAAVAGERDDLLRARRALHERGRDGPGEPDAEGLLAVRREEFARAVGAEEAHHVAAFAGSG